MIILVGASASGKTATALELQRKYGLIKAVTTTTREKRVGETNGVDYFFITREEFLKRNKEGKFVETTLYNDNFYGCGIDQVSDERIIVLDPNGLHAFKQLKDDHIITFFITCSDELRESRMRSRGDKEEKIKQRLENDIIDFDPRKIGKVDFKINTDNLTIEQVADEIYRLYNLKIKK
ncbi:MAG: AAA family ATPase [Bacilli bacterium]|nr:AAA family ATPase [Bacilli bacterium]